MSGETRSLTFGERAVGLTFNPSSNPDVDKVKQGYADIIDMMHKLRNDSVSIAEKQRLCSVAITEAQTAQMWAVKALTWTG
jgi:hypothetical protein